MTKRLFIICTHGPENAELATMVFVMATTAQASDISVLIGLQGPGAWLSKKGAADMVAAPGFPRLKHLMKIYQEGEGRMIVCGACLKARGVNPATDLVDGASVVNSGSFIHEVTEATQVLVY
jgi:predicted peroxiredoxin